MDNASPLNSLRSTLLQPTWLAIFASVGIHALLGIGWPLFPLSSKTAKLDPTINVIQLTPQEQRLLPDLSRTSQITLPPIPSPINSLPPLPALPGEGQLPKLPPLNDQVTAYNFPPLPPPDAFPKLTDLPPPISLPDLYGAMPPTTYPDWSNLTSPTDTPDWSSLEQNYTGRSSLDQPPAMSYPNWDRLPPPPPRTRFNPPATSGGTLPNTGLQAGLSPQDQMLPADQPDNLQTRQTDAKVADVLKKRAEIALRQAEQEQASRKPNASGAAALKPGTSNSGSLTPQQRSQLEEGIDAQARAQIQRQAEQQQQQQQAAATPTDSISEKDALRLRAGEAYTNYFAKVRQANPTVGMVNPQVLSVPYPKEAGSPQENAAALVGVTVNPEGKVVEAQLLTSTGNEVLDKAAVNAAIQKQYQPTEKPVVYPITVQFVPGNLPQNAAPATEKPAQNQQPTPEKPQESAPKPKKPAPNQLKIPEKPAAEQLEKPAANPEKPAATPEKPAAEQLQKPAATQQEPTLIPETPAPDNAAPAENPDKSSSAPKKPAVNQTSKDSSPVPTAPAPTQTEAAPRALEKPAPTQAETAPPAAEPAPPKTNAATPAPELIPEQSTPAAEQSAPELIPEQSPPSQESTPSATP